MSDESLLEVWAMSQPETDERATRVLNLVKKVRALEKDIEESRRMGDIYCDCPQDACAKTRARYHLALNDLRRLNEQRDALLFCAKDPTGQAWDEARWKVLGLPQPPKRMSVRERIEAMGRDPKLYENKDGQDVVDLITGKRAAPEPPDGCSTCGLVSGHQSCCGEQK